MSSSSTVGVGVLSGSACGAGTSNRDHQGHHQQRIWVHRHSRLHAVLKNCSAALQQHLPDPFWPQMTDMPPVKFPGRDNTLPYGLHIVAHPPPINQHLGKTIPSISVVGGR